MNVAATLPVILRLHIGEHDVLSAGDEKRSRQHLSGTAYSLKEFESDNIGRGFCGIVANALNDGPFRQSLLK